MRGYCLYSAFFSSWSMKENFELNHNGYGNDITWKDINAMIDVDLNDAKVMPADWLTRQK